MHASINLLIKISVLFCDYLVTIVKERFPYITVSLDEEVQILSYSALYFKWESELITSNDGPLQKPMVALFGVTRYAFVLLSCQCRVYVSCCLLAWEMQGRTFT